MSFIKKIIFAFIIIFVLGCSSTKKYNLGILNKKCFSKNDCLYLLKNSSSRKMNINSIVNSNCIGLYSLSYNIYMDNIIEQKFLKFENQIYIFNRKDTIQNNKKVKEFMDYYNHFFTNSQKDSIKFLFFEGDKYFKL